MLASPRIAAANGMELLPGGTQAVGRGGAVVARPEDPFALIQNPAGLAFLNGHRVMLSADIPMHEMCVDPYGYYGWGVYEGAPSEFGDPLALDDPNNPTPGATYATTPLGRVCNSAPSAALPSLAWTGKLGDKLAFGAGFVAPTLVAGLQFGGPDGTVQTPYGPRPTPTRYTLIKQDVNFALNPTVGVAYRVLPQLGLGMSAQFLMADVSTVGVQNGVSGTQPATDWLVTLQAKDYFIPSLTFSVHAKPIPAVDLTGGFRWVDDFRGSGEATYVTNTFHQGALTGPIPFENDPIRMSNLQVPFPWHAWLGARYASLLTDSGGTGLGDPLDTERWDVELDMSYAFNARASKNLASPGEDVTVVTRVAEGGSGSTTVPLEDLSQLEMNRHQKDYVTLRLGGNYAILPRRLAVHTGGFFESRGVNAAYADIDTFAFRRFGVGLGVVLRVGSFDLRAAYGHILSETLEVAPPPHEPVENARPGDPRSGFDQRVGGSFDQEGIRQGGVVLADPDAPSPSEADAVARKTQSSAVATAARPERVINAGRYFASFHVLSIGVVHHF